MAKYPIQALVWVGYSALEYNTLEGEGESK